MRQPCGALVHMHDSTSPYSRDAVADNQRGGSMPIMLCNQGIKPQNLGIRFGTKRVGDYCYLSVSVSDQNESAFTVTSLDEPSQVTSVTRRRGSAELWLVSRNSRDVASSAPTSTKNAKLMSLNELVGRLPIRAPHRRQNLAASHIGAWQCLQKTEVIRPLTRHRNMAV